jgi:recombination protein RecT
MGQMVRLDDRSRVIQQLFKENKGHMLAAAPKTSGDPTRLLNIAFNSIAYDDKLIQCTQQSLIGGVFEALKLGIALGGPMQEGWLIPFGQVATLIVGFQGYRNIIDRAGSVVDMHPRAVHNGRRLKGKEWVDGTPDSFDYWFGDQPRIMHKPMNSSPTMREQLRCVYVVANLRRGGKQLEVLELEEIDAHRDRSRAKNNGPWVTDFVPMGLKTGMRKISKYLPKSNELLARALDLDEKADRGADQDFEIPPSVTWIDAADSPQPKPSASPMDRLKETIGAKEPSTGQAPPPAESEIDWGTEGR